jgi:hypothetical protein
MGEYGNHAGEPPPGWVRVSTDEYICAHCAEMAKGTAVGPGP